MPETHFHAEDGIFSPPAPLPNPSDLSNGQHGEQLRFGRVNLADPEGLRKWNIVLAWLKSHGCPTDAYTFFTPVLSGGFGSTQVIFTGEEGEPSAHDATQLFNMPETALTSIRVNLGLPKQGDYVPFPGFDVIEQQDEDPVSSPLPAFNTPGWARDFPRYNAVSLNFDEARWPINSRFTRLSDGSEYIRTKIIAGRKPGPNPFSPVLDLKPVWERVR